MSGPTEEQALAAKDGAVSGGSNSSIDRASATLGMEYAINSTLSRYIEDVKARENEDKAEIEQLQVEKRRVEDDNAKLQSDMQAMATEMEGVKATREKDRLESEQKATDLEKQVKELKRQGKQKDKRIKSLAESLVDSTRCSMSPTKNDEAAASPVRQMVDAPKAAFSFPSPAGTDGVEPAASPIHQEVGATKVDAAPSFNLEDDDDGFITAPEGPEASGENKDGKKVDQTLQVVCEKQESGAETGASNEGGKRKASPSSVHGLDTKSDESGGEELEAGGTSPKKAKTQADQPASSPVQGSN
ncbi:hypothetical protein ACHAXT_002275 [Thalassiosira profunda]